MTGYRKYYRNQWLPGMSEDETDQMKGLPLPPMQKPYPADAKLVDLVAAKDMTIGQVPLIEAIDNRRSRRKYTDEPLSLEELSFLLWCTQGVQKLVRNGLLTLRTVPSGGGMHPFETYLVVNRVTGVEPGLYRYLALEHKLYPVDLRHGGLGRAGRRGEQRANFCGEGSRGLCLECEAIPHRMAVRGRFAEGCSDQRRAHLPESIPGLRGDRGGDLCHRGLPAGQAGRLDRR